MAVYSFLCKECNKKFEVLKTVKEKDQQTSCPECGSKNTKRIWEGFNLGGRKESKRPPECSNGTCPGCL